MHVFRFLVWILAASFLPLAAAFSQSAPLSPALVSDGVFTRDGATLHYTLQGSTGPYVVLLSGGPGLDVRFMTPIAEALSRQYRCVLLEQRGTGRSQLTKYDTHTINWQAYLDDLEALRQHLHTEKMTLIGNSWGMMLALAYGTQYSDHLDAIVTVGSGPITPEYYRAFSRNLRLQITATEWASVRHWLARETYRADPDRAQFEIFRLDLPAYFYDHRAGVRFAAGTRREDINLAILPAFGRALNQFDFQSRLKNITVPVLLVQGRQDPAGLDNIALAHRLIVGSQLALIDKCGHLPWLEKPEETFQLVRDFLGKVGFKTGRSGKKALRRKQLMTKIERRDDVNPKEGEREYGDVAFADPINKKYPIDTEEHIRAAWAYIHHADNAAKYDGDEAQQIKDRIARAAKQQGIEVHAP